MKEDRNYYVDLNGTIGYIPNQAKDAPVDLGDLLLNSRLSFLSSRKI